MAAPHYRRVHLKLEGWFLNPEVERVQGVDRAAGVGECGFPGCMLPDKHAGLHQVGELQPRVRNAVRPKKELECGTPSAKKARRDAPPELGEQPSAAELAAEAGRQAAMKLVAASPRKAPPPPPPPAPAAPAYRSLAAASAPAAPAYRNLAATSAAAGSGGVAEDTLQPGQIVMLTHDPASTRGEAVASDDHSVVMRVVRVHAEAGRFDARPLNNFSRLTEAGIAFAAVRLVADQFCQPGTETCELCAAGEHDDGRGELVVCAADCCGAAYHRTCLAAAAERDAARYAAHAAAAATYQPGWHCPVCAAEAPAPSPRPGAALAPARPPALALGPSLAAQRAEPEPRRVVSEPAPDAAAEVRRTPARPLARPPRPTARGRALFTPDRRRLRRGPSSRPRPPICTGRAAPAVHHLPARACLQVAAAAKRISSVFSRKLEYRRAQANELTDQATAATARALHALRSQQRSADALCKDATSVARAALDTTQRSIEYLGAAFAAELAKEVEGELGRLLPRFPSLSGAQLRPHLEVTVDAKVCGDTIAANARECERALAALKEGRAAAMERSRGGDGDRDGDRPPPSRGGAAPPAPPPLPAHFANGNGSGGHHNGNGNGNAHAAAAAAALESVEGLRQLVCHLPPAAQSAALAWCARQGASSVQSVVLADADDALVAALADGGRLGAADEKVLRKKLAATRAHAGADLDALAAIGGATSIR